MSPRHSHLKFIVFTVHNNVDDVKIMQNIFHVIYYSRGPCYRCLALHSSQIINFASVNVICVIGTIGTIVINVYWSPSKLWTGATTNMQIELLGLIGTEMTFINVTICINFKQQYLWRIGK